MGPGAEFEVSAGTADVVASQTGDPNIDPQIP